jgi:DNA-binding NtrC family response regulator
MITTVGMRQYVRVFGGTLARVEAPTATFEIPAEPAVVGRDEGCGLRLEDARVSAAHFEVMATANGARVRDLGSRNGTFVDHHRCVEMYLDRPARIRCGETVLQFMPTEPVEVDPGPSEACGDLVGSSTKMKELYQQIRRMAATDLPVLITGETGTGKELVAKALHAMSGRARGPFIVLDCTTIPNELAESTLFGHERGSFTGAIDRLVSPFVEAQGGTIFLDEIGDLPIGTQPKLLRAIQNRVIKPVGSSTYRNVNIRIVAATRRDLAREINSGGFRSDLYFRLVVFRIEVPPLRERMEDIPELAARLAADRGFGDAGQRLSVASIERMAAHDWPGNVRELEGVVVAASALASPEGPIDVTAHLSPTSRQANMMRRTTHFDTARLEFERSFWEEVCATCKTISEMERVTGVARSTVRTHLAKHGLRCVE